MFCASCISNFGTVALTELGSGEVSVLGRQDQRFS